MAGEAKTHHRATEVTEMMARFAREHAFALFLQALCVSVVRIHAKQSQFQGGRINAKCRSGRELGGNHGDHGCGKTKPIPEAEIASLACGLLAMTGTGEELAIRPHGPQRRENRAKQSQFAEGDMNGNCGCAKGLG